MPSNSIKNKPSRLATSPHGKEYLATSEGLEPNKRLQDAMNMLNEADI